MVLSSLSHNQCYIMAVLPLQSTPSANSGFDPSHLRAAERTIPAIVTCHALMCYAQVSVIVPPHEVFRTPILITFFLGGEVSRVGFRVERGMKWTSGASTPRPRRRRSGRAGVSPAFPLQGSSMLLVMELMEEDLFHAISSDATGRADSALYYFKYPLPPPPPCSLVIPAQHSWM